MAETRRAGSRKSPRKQEGAKQRREEKRAEILAHASHMFQEKGFRATSMAELAQHFGFTKPALYYYVGSKEQLLIDLVTESFNELNALVTRAWAASEDPVVQLEVLIEGHIEIVTHDAQPLMALEPADHPEAPEYGSVVRRLSRQYHRGWVDVIERGIAAGKFRSSLDPFVASLGVIGMCAWVARWYRADGPLTPAEIAAQYTTIVMDSVLVGNAR